MYIKLIIKLIFLNEIYKLIYIDIFVFKIIKIKYNKMSNNGLYDNLRKFIDVIDKLRDNGLDKYIQLPRIVVLGS
jgi:hypothetical protein